MLRGDPSSMPVNQIHQGFAPFQERNASMQYAHLTQDISNFIKNWNEDPANRTKMQQLFNNLN